MKSKVYKISVKENQSLESVSDGLKKLLNQPEFSTKITAGDLVGVKVHFGEQENSTHLDPEHIIPIVEYVRALGGKPFLAETSTLYLGERQNAVDHTLLAQAHGFGIDKMKAPIVMLDGLRGNQEYKVGINGEFYQEVSIAADVPATDVFFVASHVTGHIFSGFAAAIKNLGMGMVSRKGKLAQHSDSKPAVSATKCIFCSRCFKVCPAAAIAPFEGKVKINLNKCIGCGECLTVCPVSAITWKYDSASADLQKKMAEHAFGVYLTKKDKLVFINYLVSITDGCDCMESKKITQDIGILASLDPVAIDAASMNLIKSAAGQTLESLSQPQLNGWIQIEHAEKLGMGKMDYELIDLS